MKITNTLQNLSLEIITENFSTYTFAFILTNDEVLRKHLQFLQRGYTQEIFRALVKHETLKEDHFHFLLIEHLKEVEIFALFKCSTKENILEHLIQKAQSIDKLQNFGPADDEDSKYILYKLIPYCCNVRDISNFEICDDNLLKLISSSCPRLISLDVAASNITGEGLRSLYSESDGSIVVKCPLKYIDLNWTQIETKDVAFLLKHLPSLEVVNYDKLPSAIYYLCLLDANYENSLEKIGKLNLRKLDLEDYDNSVEIARVLYSCTKICPKIKDINLKINSSEDLILLSRFTELHSLLIQGFVSIDLSDFLVLSGKRLKVLDISGFSLAVSTLVESCPHLERVRLNNLTHCTRLHKISEQSLKKLNHLTLEEVSLTDHHCTASMVTLLNSIPKLERLDLFTFKFMNSDFEAELLKFSIKSDLKHLFINDCDFKVEFLEQFIFNCASIETLHVSQCRNINLENIGRFKDTLKTFNRRIWMYISPS